MIYESQCQGLFDAISSELSKIAGYCAWEGEANHEFDVNEASLLSRVFDEELALLQRYRHNLVDLAGAGPASVEAWLSTVTDLVSNFDCGVSATEFLDVFSRDAAATLSPELSNDIAAELYKYAEPGDQIISRLLAELGQPSVSENQLTEMRLGFPLSTRKISPHKVEVVGNDSDERPIPTNLPAVLETFHVAPPKSIGRRWSIASNVILSLAGVLFVLLGSDRIAASGFIAVALSWGIAKWYGQPNWTKTSHFVRRDSHLSARDTNQNATTTLLFFTSR